MLASHWSILLILSSHWSEPAGVIVLDSGVATEDTNCMDGVFGFHLRFGSGFRQYLGCHTPEERQAWRGVLDRYFSVNSLLIFFLICFNHIFS